MSFKMNLRSDLIARVCIITAVFSIFSYLIILKNEDVQAIPVLFVLFGVVLLISVLYDISRFHVLNPSPNTEKKP